MRMPAPAFALFVVLAVAGAARAHEGREAGAEGKDVTVHGELLDMACYMTHAGAGAKHAECAKMCVLGGAPMGLLAKDGAVYLLVENHASSKDKKTYAAAKKLVGAAVALSGDLYERGGLKAISVERVAAE